MEKKGVGSHFLLGSTSNNLLYLIKSSTLAFHNVTVKQMQ